MTTLRVVIGNYFTLCYNIFINQFFFILMVAKKKKILIGEDEKPMAHALELKLNDSGFEAKAVFNGQEIVDELKKNKYDLVLLDLVMPVMDGLSMLSLMREDADLENIPVIMLTNLNDKESVAKALENKSYDYLVKSDWKIEDVVKKVREKLL